MSIEPFKTEPFFHLRPWGGRAMETVLGKRIPDGTVAEAWEVSTHPHGVCRVATGRHAGRGLDDVVREAGPDLLGSLTYEKHAGELPVLIKLIDVNALASVQVHPDDEGARRLEGEAAGQGPARGKTEAWYIISRSTEARFSLGLAPRVTPEAFREALQRGTAPDLLASPEVREGDCLFVPPGTVHAAGNGVLLLEVQQSSDLTYRVYDWDRVDAQGRRRELHVDKALQVIDFSARPRIYHAEGGPDSLARILECPYFEMWEARVAGTLSLPPQPALASATVVRGTLRLRGRSTSLRLSPGDTFVLPAGQDAVLERSGNGQDSALAVLTLVR